MFFFWDIWRIFENSNNRMVYTQKQPSRGVLKERCSGNIQKVTPMPKCDFNVTSIKLLCNLLCIFIEITLRDDGCSQVNLQHISRTPFSKNTSGWLLLYTTSWDLGIPWICNFLSYQLPCEFSVMWCWRLPS